MTLAVQYTQVDSLLLLNTIWNSSVRQTMWASEVKLQFGFLLRSTLVTNEKRQGYLKKNRKYVYPTGKLWMERLWDDKSVSSEASALQQQGC